MTHKYETFTDNRAAELLILDEFLENVREYPTAVNLYILEVLSYTSDTLLMMSKVNALITAKDKPHVHKI